MVVHVCGHSIHRCHRWRHPISFLCAVVMCRPRCMSLASRVLIVIVCPHCVIVSCPPCRCPVLLSFDVAPVLEILGGGGELTHLGSSLPMSVHGCWSSFTTRGGWSYVGGHLCLWVAGFVFWAVMVAVQSLVVIGVRGRSRGRSW